MSLNNRRLFHNVKSQITFFIIVGILFLIAVGVIVTIRTISERKAGADLTKIETSEELTQAVQNYVDS